MYYQNYYEYCNVDVLKGKTLVSVDVSDDAIRFKTSDGELYKMYHEQDCCESVGIEDIVGDLQDLVGSEILMAEEVEGESPADFDERGHDSYSWTFYKLATIKGYVDIRWFGSSNGYYSEGVDFCKVVS
jgi:hypothetical protein